MVLKERNISDKIILRYLSGLIISIIPLLYLIIGTSHPSFDYFIIPSFFIFILSSITLISTFFNLLNDTINKFITYSLYILFSTHLIALFYINNIDFIFITILIAIILNSITIYHSWKSYLIYSTLIILFCIVLISFYYQPNLDPTVLYITITSNLIFILVFYIRQLLEGKEDAKEEEYEHWKMPVIKTLPNGTIQYINPYFVELIGYKGDINFLLKKWWDYSQLKESWLNRKEILRLSENKQGYARNVERNFDTFKNKNHWIQWTNTVLPDHSIIGIGQDITPLKLQEQGLRDLSLVADKTDNIVAIVDALGEIIWVNSAFENSTEYRFEEAHGKKLEYFLAGELTQIHAIQKLDEAKEKAIPIQVEIMFKTKSGSKRWFTLSMTPVMERATYPEKFIYVGIETTEEIENRKNMADYAERLNHMHKMDQAMMANRSVEEVVKNVLDYIFHYFDNCNRISFSLLEPDTFIAKVLLIRNSEGYYNDIKEVINTKALRCYNAISKGEIYKEKDIHELDELNPIENLLIDSGVRSYIILPIMYDNHMEAALNISFSDILSLPEKDFDLLNDISAELSLVLYFLRMRKNIEEKNLLLTEQNKELTSANEELRQFAYITS
ncbi:MAG: PAS domain S-box protein, partial [Cyclobacteriaceae bacterium]|nr:PAS domain S-box protein [Cyclobacteriaceae bacterium]